MNNALVKQKIQLPSKIEDLTKFVLVGREKLVSVKAEIRAINKIGLAKEVREQKNEEAQMLASALLDAESKIGELIKESCPSTAGRTKVLPEGITHKQSHFFQTLANNPEVVEQVKAEAVENDDLPTRTEVIRQVKIKEQKEEFDRLFDRAKKKTPINIKERYDVIVIDPPWPMEKIERNVRPNQHGFDYPTMSEDQLRELTIPNELNCHVFVWTTQKFLPMALRLLERWYLNYICIFVWHKPGGFQPVGLPQYNCEFVVYARCGSPKFINTKAFNTCFQAPRGKHSEKPEEFYDILRRVTVGKKLDMFNRREIEGFDRHGYESG